MQIYAKQQSALLAMAQHKGKGRRQVILPHTPQWPVTKIWYGAIATTISGQLELLVLADLPGETDLCYIGTNIRFLASEVVTSVYGLELMSGLARNQLFVLRSALFALTVRAITEGINLNRGHIEVVIGRVVTGESFRHRSIEELTSRAITQIKQRLSLGQITAAVGCHRLTSLDDALASLVNPFLYIP